MNYSIFSNAQVFIGTINFIGIGLSVKWVTKCDYSTGCMVYEDVDLEEL